MSMRKRRKRTGSVMMVDERARKLLEYWSLKMLLDLGGHKEFLKGDFGFSDDGVAAVIGLEAYMDDYDESKRSEVMGVLEKRLQELEGEVPLKFPRTLKRNIKKISTLMNLNRVEKEILGFTVLLSYYDDILDNASRTLNDLSSDRVVYVLAVLLDIELFKIKQALLPQGKLARTGLLTMDRDYTASLKNKLDLLSRDFADRMMNVEGEIEEMIRDSVRKCSPSELTVADFDHLNSDLGVMLPYLQSVIDTQERGANILLYGRPGTGKTELAKAVAKALKVKIYEVSYADSDDEPISGTKRLKAYKIAQSFFGNNDVILLFDEIEDVVGDENGLSFFAPPKQSNKGWMNRILENNKVPAIWITNDIYSMDPALIRRFDMSLEIPIPPKAKRKEIIQKECGDLLSPKSIDKIATNEAIAPALISRARKVVSSIDAKEEEKEKAFANILNNTLKAQGYPKIVEKTEEALPQSYDPAYINADTDLEMLAEGIKANPNARLCLYGVPGTGKSAFGKWIAKYTQRPFVLKKGSDLISMYVGGTEKNIAQAFQEAREEGAVLVFDEVDSFLQDRRSAQRSWEVTQVNEMLVQMENFDGIFIATTNLMEGLDQASLRRFDIKLEFRALQPKHAFKLFREECKTLGIEIEKEKHLLKKLEGMRGLTPGDFAAVRRQHKFRPVGNVEDFIERLMAELAVKETTAEKKMGFALE